ncbi:CHRD domain-containing protein [Streptomyces sp. NPDC091377]|uniref:CHRD domain-containing protein n=1 Tax=Streptomyces sp. NPDC091377 TaxID=3365995 RepID=UPI003808428C
MRRLLSAAQAVLLSAGLTAGLTACAAPVTGGADTGAAPRGTGRATAPGTATGSPGAVPGGPGTSLIARLGGPGAGAAVLAKVSGERVTFSLSWSGVEPPRRAEVRRTAGDAGTGGTVLLFDAPLPDGTSAAAGQLTLTDAALAEALRGRPGDFTVTLTAAGAPDGVLSGPVTVSDTPVDPLGVIPGGALRATADGTQESEAAPGGGGTPGADGADGAAGEAGEAGEAGGAGGAGDPDASTTVSLDPGQGTLGYSLAWVNLEPPTQAHLQRGALGQDGEIAVPLFTSALPDTVIALAGTAPVSDPATLRELASAPGGFYVSLHTADFPQGAVRGQVFR